MTDRRDFIKTMAIGGASAMAGSSLFTSCDNDRAEISSENSLGAQDSKITDILQITPRS